MALLNNDIVEMSMRGRAFGQAIILTQTYVCLGDAPVLNSIATDLQKFLDAWDLLGVVDVRTQYLACLPATYTLDVIRAQRIRAVRSAYVDIHPATPGTNVNPATVANDSAALTMRTMNAGRNQVATKHIGPAPDAASVAGLITPAYLALIQALGTKLLTSFVPATLGLTAAPVIFHRKTNTFDLQSGFAMGEQSRVQRRRTVGLGI